LIYITLFFYIQYIYNFVVLLYVLNFFFYYLTQNMKLGTADGVRGRKHKQTKTSQYNLWVEDKGAKEL